MKNRNKIKNLERYMSILIDKIDNYCGGCPPKFTLEIELERCQEELKELVKE